MAAARDALEMVAGSVVEIQETVRFGGKLTTITKTVAAGSDAHRHFLAESAKAAQRSDAKRRRVQGATAALEGKGASAGVSGLEAASAMAGGGLGRVLEQLEEAKKISTVAKSAHDWDAFKTKNKLDEEVADAGKEGFVTRQEFLARVDQRAHGQVVAARQRERARRQRR